MPRNYKSKGKKRGAGKRKRTANITEHASMSVAEALPNGNDPGLVYRQDAIYSKINTNLSSFERAVQVAQAYQFYRIKNIRLTFKSAFDTFSTGTGVTPTTMKPNFYYMLDKAGAVPATINFEGMRSMGSRPIALDEKPINVNWSPSVLTAAGDSGGGVFVGTDYKISPWLSTNSEPAATSFSPSTVQHLGCYWGAEMKYVTDKNFFYTVDIEIQFEFKKPIWKEVTSEDKPVQQV